MKSAPNKSVRSDSRPVACPVVRYPCGGRSVPRYFFKETLNNWNRKNKEESNGIKVWQVYCPGTENDQVYP